MSDDKQKKPRKNSLAAKAEQAASAGPEPQAAPEPVPEATPSQESTPPRAKRPKKGKAAAPPAPTGAESPVTEADIPAQKAGDGPVRPAAAAAPAVKEIKRKPPPRRPESDRPKPPPREEPKPAPKKPEPKKEPPKADEVAQLLKGNVTLPDPPGPTPEEEAARKARRTRLIFAVLFPACALLLIVSLFQYARIQRGYSDAQSEYDALAQQAFPDSSQTEDNVEYIDVSHQELMMLPEEERPMTLLEVMERNEDCVAWIEIPETQVNYPLVQGADNDAYLNRTFLGNVNSAGAIFLDYRNEFDMSSLHSIIYGHNMRNGSMFGGLYNFLDASYLQEHPNVYVHNGSQKLRYRIVGARVSDKWDDAYRVDFANAEELDAFFRAYGAPAGTEQVLTLSTCTDGPKEERVLVHAVYEGVEPA